MADSTGSVLDPQRFESVNIQISNFYSADPESYIFYNNFFTQQQYLFTYGFIGTTALTELAQTKKNCKI